jgi:PKD repeat protein
MITFYYKKIYGRKEKMNTKMISFFIVILLITFGIGFSIGSLFRQDIQPSVKALSNINSGRAPLNVSFSYKAYGCDEDIKNCLWDFNDGTKSNKSTTVHTFQREGIFNVSINLWNEEGEKISDSIKIHVFDYFKPRVSIIANNTYGKIPLKVKFNSELFDIDGNKSECTWHWDFDDKTTSEEKDPTHVFDKTGQYTVRLTVFDCDGLENTDVIQINAVDNHPPTAHATADKNEGKAPLTVDFTGSHEDIDGDKSTYHWYFENTLVKDNSESWEQNPSHTFKSPGTYLVKLTVEDEQGATDTDTVRIDVKESLISTVKDLILDFSISRIIKQSLPDCIGKFIMEFFSTFLGKVSGNILANNIIK